MSRSNRGTAMVELAIAMMLLLSLILGMLEFGAMYRNYLAASEVARMGSRSAALGSSTSVIAQHINQTRMTLGLDSPGALTSTMQYRVYTKSSGVWSGWQPLSDTPAGYNSAPCSDTEDSQVRVTVTYTYPLITGAFLAPLVGNQGNVVLTSSSVMRREKTP